MNKINEIMLSLEKHKTWIKKYKYPDDLYQESIISLLKQGNEKIINLYNKKELDAYFSTVVRMTDYQTRSQHNTNFKDDRNLVYTSKIKERVYTITPDLDLQEEVKKVSNYWYDQEILKLYAIHGTVSKVSKETTIPHKTIEKTITKLKKRIL